jgi:serine phosphatase RsbU (regulator of sigma subunit)
MEPTTHSPLSAVEWSVAAQALPGQTVSGDQYLIKPYPSGILFAAVDGLGHGDEATAAARSAVATLANHAHESVIFLAHRCNEALVKTRGVVMTLASLNLAKNTITWLGIGNVEGLLIRADPRSASKRETVLLRGGVVGYQVPTLQSEVIPMRAGDLLVFATDGIRSGFAEGLSVNDSPKQIADRIMAKYFKGTDDALAMVVRYRGGKNG